MENPEVERKVLHLTLKKEAFEVMVSGEKFIEYRKEKPWITTRLLNKDGTRKEYDFVLFRNGYSENSSWFLIEFIGFWHTCEEDIIYSNGLRVSSKDEVHYAIRLGNLVALNIKEK